MRTWKMWRIICFFWLFQWNLKSYSGHKAIDEFLSQIQSSHYRIWKTFNMPYFQESHHQSFFRIGKQHEDIFPGGTMGIHVNIVLEWELHANDLGESIYSFAIRKRGQQTVWEESSGFVCVCFSIRKVKDKSSLTTLNPKRKYQHFISE